MNLINLGDITNTFYKLRLRGLKFIISKLNTSVNKRVKSTFNQPEIKSVNYWDIPAICKQWNYLITGKLDCLYEDYIVGQCFSNKEDLHMLSVGCGGGHHELRFAKHKNFSTIKGIDLAPNLIHIANLHASKLGYANLKFEVQDFYKYELENNIYDVIHFYGSLHHFKPMKLVLEKVKQALKPDGYLIIQEYVGPTRFQFPKEQIQEINKQLINIPKQLRIKYLSNSFKSKVYAPGLIRMILADPSEALDSSSIRPVLKELFSPVIEVELGGNISQLLFKDIAHHFKEETKEANAILDKVLEKEKEYISISQSDFIFGIYKNDKLQ